MGDGMKEYDLYGSRVSSTASSQEEFDLRHIRARINDEISHFQLLLDLDPERLIECMNRMEGLKFTLSLVESLLQHRPL